MSTFYWLPADYNVKSFNKHAALDLIRFSTSGLSRSDLADQMGLTRAAVSLIINDLIDTGIVPEAESRSAPSGRPPVVLEINPDHGRVAAVDMGATHISLAIADFTARILQEIEFPFNIKAGPEACLIEVNLCLSQLLESQRLTVSARQ